MTNVLESIFWLLIPVTFLIIMQFDEDDINAVVCILLSNLFVLLTII